MISLPVPYKTKTIVPRHKLRAWRAGLRRSQSLADCPQEVKDFIDVIADKMNDFGKIKNYTVMIPGRDILLSGFKEWKGEPVFAFASYPFEVPHMVAVDHHTWMHRIFRRKGKQGLIDYCRVQVKETELQHTLEVLEVAVFHNERPEFKQVMEQIRASEKIELLPA